MVWNERLKREIPDSWKVASIIDNPFAAVIKPGVSRFEIKTYLATADVNGTSIGSGTPVQYETRETRANMEPSLHSVWFAKMKASVKHLFFSESTKPVVDSSILSTGFLGLQCNEISFEYISSFVSSPFFEAMKDQLAHGATQEAVNNDNLRFIPLLVPDERVVAAFHKKACESYWVMGGNVIENKTLTGLRDWLLPMLMNGQATVRQPQANYRLVEWFHPSTAGRTPTELPLLVVLWIEREGDNDEANTHHRCALRHGGMPRRHPAKTTRTRAHSSTPKVRRGRVCAPIGRGAARLTVSLPYSKENRRLLRTHAHLLPPHHRSIDEQHQQGCPSNPN